MGEDAIHRAVSPEMTEGQARDGMCLTDEERHRILRRLHSTLSWVGVRIPEEAELGGRHVKLRDMVDRYVFDDSIDEEERSQIDWLVERLEERIDLLEEELEEDDLCKEEAEALLRRTIGLLRAVDELSHLDDEEEWEDRRRQVMEEVDDARRWHEFTKRVYHKDEYY